MRTLLASAPETRIKVVRASVRITLKPAEKEASEARLCVCVCVVKFVWQHF